MFFEPPKVKSLSRYAEYGAYLGSWHFLLMLTIAFTVHIGFIVIYSMSPSQKVIRIPVQALNIKLTGGSLDNGVHMPAPSAMPVIQSSQDETAKPSEDMKRVEVGNPESVVDNAIKEPKKPVEEKHHPAPAPVGKTVFHPAPYKRTPHAHATEGSLATPKRYIRETEGAKTQAGKGDGKNVGGDVNGKDAIERYTQVVSQWIKNHQAAAREAYKEAVQGQDKVRGQAVIRLRIDRDGHILYNSVDHTSGSELVDQAAIAMVRASDPVPSVPSDYPSDSQLEFLIAVQVDFARQ